MVGVALPILLSACLEYPGTTSVSASGIVTDAVGNPMEGASVAVMLYKDEYPVKPVAFAHMTTDRRGRFLVDVKSVTPEIWSILFPQIGAEPVAVCAACKKGTAMTYFPCDRPGSQVVLYPWAPWPYENHPELRDTYTYAQKALGIMPAMLPECDADPFNPISSPQRTSTEVGGHIISGAGKPIAGAVVHAVRIRGVVGIRLGEAAQSRVLNHDRFITNASGHYAGRLGYADYVGEQNTTYGGMGVIYYACHAGYQPALIPFPKMIGMDVHLYPGDDKNVPRGMPSKLPTILSAPLCE